MSMVPLLYVRQLFKELASLYLPNDRSNTVRNSTMCFFTFYHMCESSDSHMDHDSCEVIIRKLLQNYKITIHANNHNK